PRRVEHPQRLRDAHRVVRADAEQQRVHPDHPVTARPVQPHPRPSPHHPRLPPRPARPEAPLTSLPTRRATRMTRRAAPNPSPQERPGNAQPYQTMNSLPDGPDARVTYTVKEILLRMEANADERHRDLRKRIDDIHKRVDELEAER